MQRNVNLVSCSWVLHLNPEGDRWEKPLIPPLYHPLFPSLISFHISSLFWSHLTLISHLMGSESSFSPLRSPGMRGSLLFNQSLLRPLVDGSHAGARTSPTILWISPSYDITTWPLTATLTERYCPSGQTMSSAGHLDLDKNLLCSENVSNWDNESVSSSSK